MEKINILDSYYKSEWQNVSQTLRQRNKDVAILKKEITRLKKEKEELEQEIKKLKGESNDNIELLCNKLL